MEQLGYDWRDFHEIWYDIFLKSVEKIKFSLRSARIAGTLREYVFKCMISRLINKRFTENDSTYFMFSHFFQKITLFMR